MNILRSILFNIFFYPLLIVSSLIIILFYPFVTGTKLQSIANNLIILILVLLKHMCRIDWEISGLDNIPDGPVIFVSNHQGPWESFFLQTLKIPSTSIIKKELLVIPFFGWALACLGPIYINRTNKYTSLKKVIAKGTEKLKNGYSIIMFPEGTRARPHKGLKKFSSSCGLLSVHNNVPIVPICHNSGLYWKNRKFTKEMGTVNVLIGKPIYGDSPKDCTAKAFDWINLKFKEIH